MEAFQKELNLVKTEATSYEPHKVISKQRLEKKSCVWFPTHTRMGERSQQWELDWNWRSLKDMIISKWVRENIKIKEKGKRVNNKYGD